jgi:hypothetical protein
VARRGAAVAVRRAPGGGGGGWICPVLLAVGARPRLWPTAVSQARRLARPRWWRRWPPLPLPDPEYLRFRARTAYGDPTHPPEPDDVVAWLSWCRGER